MECLSMSEYIFVFDLDSTITKKEILPTIAEKIGKLDEMRELTESTMMGIIPFKTSFINRVKLLEKLNVSFVSDTIKDIPLNENIAQFIMENSKKVNVSNDDANNIYSLFENEFGRALTPFEIDTIRDWIESGFTIDLVKSALNEAVRNKVRSIKYVDRILLNYRQQEEIKKEGNTTISEKWRKDIDETMNIAKTRWVKEND